jgi:hypothetical protein
VERIWLPHFAFGSSGEMGICAPAPTIKNTPARPNGTILAIIVDLTTGCNLGDTFTLHRLAFMMSVHISNKN